MNLRIDSGEAQEIAVADTVRCRIFMEKNTVLEIAFVAAIAAEISKGNWNACRGFWDSLWQLEELTPEDLVKIMRLALMGKERLLEF